MARNQFTGSGHSASLGVKMIAFTWTVSALLLVGLILNCGICLSGRNSYYGNRDSSTFEKSSFVAPAPAGPSSPIGPIPPIGASSPISGGSRRGKKRGFFNVNRTPQPEQHSSFASPQGHEPQNPAMRSSYERGQIN